VPREKGKMFCLSNKIALITGATGGIGEAIAQAFHQQGATVVLSGTKADVLEAFSQKLKERVHFFPCNLKNKEEAQGLIGRIEEKLGELHILVNNAGLTRDNLSMRMKDEEYQDVIDVNLSAPFYLMRAAVRGMMKNKWGRIINISSIVGFTGNPGQINYCATKAGIVGMTKSLAQEIASRGITVNCIAPGFIASAMTNHLPEAHRAKLLATIPQGKMGLPDDIASAAVFLASDEAAYITGQTIHVNGGMAMI
jgi:3-oxoacyl-[acyl-carrier protein] reductase